MRVSLFGFIAVLVLTWVPYSIKGADDRSRKMAGELIKEVQNLRSKGEYEQAIFEINERLPQIFHESGQNERLVFPIRFELGELHMLRGDYGQAQPPLRRVYETLKELLPENQKNSTWLGPVTLDLIISIHKMPLDELLPERENSFERYLNHLRRIYRMAPMKSEIRTKWTEKLERFGSRDLLQQVVN